ncbi:MAG TPA: phosphate ABC transporter substrate-binding protein PstS [Gemmatimonadales bacterium]|jgi:phosphate transport system substrate-binding protein|nr:phosphate ABC transporter substrate-binding protein PstS [Gemmatimonadales bacterium]
MIGRTLPWGLGLTILALASQAEAAAGQRKLTGAGATFPNPIYTKWFDAYHKKSGVQINYQSIGSGGGIRQFTEGTVDFGATDGPMTDAQIEAVQGNVVHIPTVIGAVVLTYNLPSLGGTRLKLDGQTVVDMYLGRITRWNDQRIAALNPGVNLPALDLIVVHRSDGSGTTYVFTDYLAKISPEWRDKVGSATSVNWPAGLGGKGNEGVTQQVKQVEGAVGYVELIYAVANRLPFALLRNAAGRFVEPSLESATAAAASANLGPDTDFRVSITNAPGPKTYPITSFTWLLVRKDDKNVERARLLRDFLNWMITDEAQRMAVELQYAPLPAPIRELVARRIKTLKAGGKPVALR